MKKSNILFVLLFVASTAFAQIEVLPNGNVGIGTTSPVSELDVRGTINARQISTSNIQTSIIEGGCTATSLVLRMGVGRSLGSLGSIMNNSLSFGLDAGIFSSPMAAGNVAIGAGALPSRTSGSNNTAVGRNANVGIGLSNSTAIGHGALATQNNQVVLGNTAVGSIQGQVLMTTFSDGRAKRSVRTEVPGLAFINLLNPVLYNINLDAVDELMGIDRAEQERAMMAEFEMISSLSDLTGEERAMLAEVKQAQAELFAQERAAREARQRQLQTGFIAQDVRSAAESIGFDFSGIDVDELGIYGLRYAGFVVPLVRAVQELSQLNEQLIARIEQLERGIIGIPAPPPIQTMSAPAPASNNDWTSFDDDAGNTTAALYQNVPNPFRQGTEIRFYLPQTVATAFLIFYDLQGRKLHQVTLTQRGEGVEIIQGSQFAPGIYLYALIADGQAVAVKRMIITE